LFDAAARLLMTATGSLPARGHHLTPMRLMPTVMPAAAAPLDVKPYATMTIDEIMHRTMH
jgi:hypothetical protein